MKIKSPCPISYSPIVKGLNIVGLILQATIYYTSEVRSINEIISDTCFVDNNETATDCCHPISLGLHRSQTRKFKL